MDNNQYLSLLSKDGLTVPSIKLANFTCNCFAALDYTCDVIHQEKEPGRTLGEHVLSRFCHKDSFTCDAHAEWGFQFASRIIVNVFFNNKKKLVNADNRRNNVKDFKKRQRYK